MGAGAVAALAALAAVFAIEAEAGDISLGPREGVKARIGEPSPAPGPVEIRIWRSTARISPSASPSIRPERQSRERPSSAGVRGK